jgi:hypothetical protein
MRLKQYQVDGVLQRIGIKSIDMNDVQAVHDTYLRFIEAYMISEAHVKMLLMDRIKSLEAKCKSKKTKTYNPGVGLGRDPSATALGEYKLRCSMDDLTLTPSRKYYIK